jgi:hypothetical protein
MLVYHPAFDAYHGIFRALLLLESTAAKKMPFDALRIVDLLLLFPYLLGDFKFPKGAGFTGRKLAGQQSRFNSLPAPSTFATQMRGMHQEIVSALAGNNLIEAGALKLGSVERTSAAVPAEIFKAATTEDIELSTFLGSTIAPIPLHGKDGLKARSKLLEFRYDPT